MVTYGKGNSMNYRVIWEIDIEADTPEEAAAEALAIQRDPCSFLPVFEVRYPNGRWTYVDMDAAEREQNEV